MGVALCFYFVCRLLSNYSQIYNNNNKQKHFKTLKGHCPTETTKFGLAISTICKFHQIHNLTGYKDSVEQNRQ